MTRRRRAGGSWLIAALVGMLHLPVHPASLFDGKNPRDHWRGWAQETYPEAWVAHRKTLTLQGPVQDGWHRGGGYLLSRERFGDFDLRFEFQTSPGANSGIMVRVDPGPGVEWPWQSGTEYQILDPAAPSEPGAHADRTADLYGLVAATRAKLKEPGHWNQGRIVACGRHLEHWLNGVRVLKVDLDGSEFRQRVAASKFAAFPGFGRSADGHIALQDHGKAVWFRRLVVVRLDPHCQAVQP